MIMRTVTVVAVVCFAVSASLTATGPVQEEDWQHALSVTGEHDDAGIKMQRNVTAFAAKFIQDYITKAVCSYSSEFCAKHQIQSRGIQSYLATAGTMFAGILGVMMTKIKILVILSLMTTIIGKMLLFYAFLKFHHYEPHHYHHNKAHHHVPFVKYTKDKYYIKNTPTEHNHDVIVDHETHHNQSPYRGHTPSGGVSYYKR